MSVVVVTGAAGMLGSGLVDRLSSAGHTVRGLDLRSVADRPGCHHVTGDIRDATVLRRVMTGADAVVHCAAALPSYRPTEIASIIVDGTRAVLTAARDADVERVVHISSTAVYGLPQRVPTGETHPRAPVDTYSRAKVAAEEVAERLRRDGLCVPVLRPKTFLGPGRMGLFAMLFEWAEEGRSFPVLGRGEVRIQMLAMTDLLDAVRTVLDAPRHLADDTFNVGAAEFGTLREDFQAVLDAAGHGGRVVGLPLRPAHAVLTTLQRCHLSPVYGRLLHKLRADSYVSIDKITDRLGFRPRSSNRDAILATYDWWRTHRRAVPAGPGRTSRDAWQQGALALAKHAFPPAATATTAPVPDGSRRPHPKVAAPGLRPVPQPPR